MASKGLFLLLKGKCVSLSRSIVLNFESAGENDSVSYARR